MNFRLRYEETGETRPPMAGEFFRGARGEIVQARFDFVCQSFPILREVLEPDSVKRDSEKEGV